MSETRIGLTSKQVRRLRAAGIGSMAVEQSVTVPCERADGAQFDKGSDVSGAGAMDADASLPKGPG